MGAKGISIDEMIQEILEVVEKYEAYESNDEHHEENGSGSQESGHHQEGEGSQSHDNGNASEDYSYSQILSIVESVIKSLSGESSNESGEQGGNTNENGSNEGNEGSNELSTETIPVNGAGNYTALDDVAETFQFAKGTYEYTIENFDLDHDVLDLPNEPKPTVINTGGSNWDKDGKVTVQWAGDGNVIQVHLIGLTQDEDHALLWAGDLGDALV